VIIGCGELLLFDFISPLGEHELEFLRFLLGSFESKVFFFGAILCILGDDFFGNESVLWPALCLGVPPVGVLLFEWL
jgi:hypothetical protein